MCTDIGWHTLQCHSQGWRWWRATEPKSSWGQRPARQRSTGLELKATAAGKIPKHLTISHKKKGKSYFVNDQSTLTSRANSVGVFIFGTEDSLLHHPEEYDPCYPELDPQQILPVACCPDKPEQGVQDVHYAHHHVELQTDSEGLVYKNIWKQFFFISYRPHSRQKKKTDNSSKNMTDYSFGSVQSSKIQRNVFFKCDFLITLILQGLCFFIRNHDFRM